MTLGSPFNILNGLLHEQPANVQRGFGQENPPFEIGLLRDKGQGQHAGVVGNENGVDGGEVDEAGGRGLRRRRRGQTVRDAEFGNRVHEHAVL